MSRAHSEWSRSIPQPLELSGAELIAEHTGRIDWSEFHGSNDVEKRSAVLEAAQRQREAFARKPQAWVSAVECAS